MEPLCQRAGESWPPDEAVVASIRAVTKELQESVQDLCKTSLAKITTLCQCFYFSTITVLVFLIRFSFSVFLINIEAKLSHVMVDVWKKGCYLLIKFNLLSIVNQESVTAPTSNCAAAGVGSTKAADNDGPLQTQSTGTLNRSYSVKEKDDVNSGCA